MRKANRLHKQISVLTFVKDQDRTFSKNCASEAKQLALANTEIGSAFGNDRIQALGLLFNDIQHARIRKS